MKDRLAVMTPSDREHLTRVLKELKRRKDMELARTSFLAFVKIVWPKFIYGRHHARVAQEFEGIADGTNNRLIINMSPRSTKSEFASYLLPAWYLGRFPDHKVIQCSVTAELAVGFGRKVRNLVASEAYQEVFPGVSLQTDSKAAGRWNTNAGGTYYAVGISGSVTGIGCDLCLGEYTKILTARGVTIAKEVVLGDRVWGSDGFGEVTQLYKSKHKEEYLINGLLRVTTKHPIWTANRGWVAANELNAQDYLQCESYSSILGVINNLRRYLDAKSTYSERPTLLSTFTYLQYLGAYATKMYKSKRSQLQTIWGSRGSGLRAMEQLKEFYRRYGASSLREAYTRQDRQRGGLYPPELPMGRWRSAGEQPTEQRKYYRIWANNVSSKVGTEDGAYSGYDKASHICDGASSRRRTQDGKTKLGAKNSIAKVISRGRDSLFSVTRRYGEGYRIQQKCGVEGYSRAIKNILWALLGIRRLRTLELIQCPEDEVFVNFTVSGHNTYIADTYLTHNCIIDDPHDEQQATAAITSPEVYDKVYEWYKSGPRQRLQPNGKICLVMTRWSKRDLTGQMLEAAKNGGDQWKAISLPAILPSGKPLWPEFWSIEELEATRAAIDISKWQAQYQQNPTSEEGAIIKREWWKKWPSDTPPETTFILQTWDTAFEKNQRADYSACITWGVFYHPDETGLEQANIIMLDAKRGRYEFPELKKVVLDEYKYWEPDSIIIEKKASGAPLIYELRAMGIPVGEFTPTRGNDKISRLNAVSDIVASGRVWVPNTRFADEVIEEVAAFPAGQHDDYTDNVSCALARFRKGGFITTRLDKPDEIQEFRGRGSRRAAYY